MTSLKVKMYASTYAWPICRNAWFGFDKIALISNLLYVKQIATNCNDFAFFLDVLRNPTNFSTVLSEGKITFDDNSKFYLKLLTT